MPLVKILAVLTLIGSIAWLIAEPGYEPALVVIAGVSALISVFIVEKKRKKSGKQNQTVSDSSIGIQAGHDVNISNRGGGKNAK